MGRQTVSTKSSGLREFVRFARGLDCERVWGIEDCRHVPGTLEQLLVWRGGRGVRVSRSSLRARGACLVSAGSPMRSTTLRLHAQRFVKAPTGFRGPFLDEQAMAIELLLDHREDLESESTRIQNRLRWHLLELARARA